jgi:hypothetical protein
MTRSRLALAFGEALELDLVSGERAPADTEALVVAQDVHLILGEAGVIEDTRETPQQVLSAATESRPRRRGSVVVSAPQGGGPLLLQAIVYDFGQSPPARDVHVFEALLAAFEEARGRGLSRVAVQPLGTNHSGMAPGRFLQLLAQVCYSTAEMGSSLRRVHLLLRSPEELSRYEELLPSLSRRANRRG